MKKLAIVLIAACMFGAGSAPVPAQAATPVDKGIVSADYIVIAATVESVDQERRTITLKGPGDKLVNLKASKKVNNFDELKKGDPVSAEYLDTVAIIVRKPDGKSHPGYLREVVVAPRGKDSAGLPVDTVEAIGTVESIDYDHRTFTFREPAGSNRTYKADERVKKFRNLQKGDKVFIRVTEPLAVRIKPVEK